MKLVNFAGILFIAGALGLVACDSENRFSGSPGAFGGGAGGGGTGGGGTGGGVTEPTAVFAPDHIFGYGAAMLAGDSSKLIFTDDSDTLGTNPDNDWQIWSLDLNNNVLTQVTSFVYTFLPRYALGEDSPIDISENGEFVVFITDAEVNGVNPDNLPSLFIVATDGSSTTQVLANDLPGAAMFEPVISGDGSTVAFLSFNDLTGENPGLVKRLFAIDADGSNLRQVTTQDLANLKSLSFSDDGSKIAFASFIDPFGLNTDNDWEIFVIDIDGSNLRQITVSDPTPGGGRESNAPKLSDDGSLVVFTSDADHSPGGNTDPNFEVYVAPTAGGAITQLTSSADKNIGLDEDTIVGGYEISGDGRYVVFGAAANLVGGNSNLDYTLFWVPTAGGTPAQVLRDATIATGATQDRDAMLPSINNNGSMISFVSVHNFTSLTQPGLDKIYTIVRQ